MFLNNLATRSEPSKVCPEQTFAYTHKYTRSLFKKKGEIPYTGAGQGLITLTTSNFLRANFSYGFGERPHRFLHPDLHPRVSHAGDLRLHRHAMLGAPGHALHASARQVAPVRAILVFAHEYMHIKNAYKKRMFV